MKPALKIGSTLLASAALAGCITRPPTIAHVHVGHALTAVHVTPDQSGYFDHAERRAAEARAAIQRARADGPGDVARTEVIHAVSAVVDEDAFGLRHALSMAINHISFAATSPDATLNLQDWAPRFQKDAQRVLERCELIALLGRDYAATTNPRESAVLLEEIAKLVDANVEGEDFDDDGRNGNVPVEFGMRQLRASVDGMLAEEQPAYRPVDHWYLFNLVLLPNGRWVYDKFSRGGQIAGYK